MQIHYCYTCNKRVDSDDSVTRDDKVYCRACAAKISAPDDDLPHGRATPSRGLQRRTPANKTPGKPSNTPMRGSQSPISAPARTGNSKTNIRPATPAKGMSRASGGNAIPARSSGGHAIPARASGANAIPPRSSGANAVMTRASGANAIPPRSSASNIAPARSSGASRRPSGGNPTLSQSSGEKGAARSGGNAEAGAHPQESRRPRKNNMLIWVLAAVAMLLAGVGAALLVGGTPITSPPPITQPK